MDITRTRMASWNKWVSPSNHWDAQMSLQKADCHIDVLADQWSYPLWNYVSVVLTSKTMKAVNINRLVTAIIALKMMYRQPCSCYIATGKHDCFHLVYLLPHLCHYSLPADLFLLAITCIYARFWPLPVSGFDPCLKPLYSSLFGQIPSVWTRTGPTDYD